MDVDCSVCGKPTVSAPAIGMPVCTGCAQQVMPAAQPAKPYRALGHFSYQGLSTELWVTSDNRLFIRHDNGEAERVELDNWHAGLHGFAREYCEGHRPLPTASHQYVLRWVVRADGERRLALARGFHHPVVMAESEAARQALVALLTQQLSDDQLLVAEDDSWTLFTRQTDGRMMLLATVRHHADARAVLRQRGACRYLTMGMNASGGSVRHELRAHVGYGYRLLCHRLLDEAGPWLGATGRTSTEIL